MATQRVPRREPAPTIARFRADQRSGLPAASGHRRDGHGPYGHGLYLLDSVASLPQLLADDPARILPTAQQAAARQALAANPVLACAGLQRLDWRDDLGRAGSLSFAIGLSRRDRQQLLRTFEGTAPKATSQPLSASRATATRGAVTQPVTLPVLVIGAGLAGAFAAAALTRRGHRVIVTEREAAPGGAVADVPLLAQHPALSRDDNARSRLSRAAMLMAWRLRDHCGPALRWCGRRQRVEGQACDFLGGWPAELARAEPPTAAAPAAIHFERCALACRATLFDTLLKQPAIDLRLGQEIQSLHQDALGWWAQHRPGKPPLGPFAAVIVACPDHERLTGLGPPWLPAGQRVPGQVLIGKLRDAAGSDQRQPHIEGGFRADKAPFTLEWGPYRVVGLAQPGDAEMPLTGALAGADLTRIADVSATDELARSAGERDWRVSQPALRLDPIDHLPLIGAVPDQAALADNATALARNDRLPYPLRPHLYLATGLGGRGLLWSLLAGECLAAAIDDEPPLLEASLYAAIDPARFARRRLRRGQLGSD